MYEQQWNLKTNAIRNTEFLGHNSIKRFVAVYDMYEPIYSTHILDKSIFNLVPNNSCHIKASSKVRTNLPINVSAYWSK